MIAAKEFKKMTVRADFLETYLCEVLGLDLKKVLKASEADRAKLLPATIRLKEIRRWEGTCTNKSGFRQNRKGRNNPALPLDRVGPHGNVLTSPTWLCEGADNPYRISLGVYTLPWSDLFDYYTHKKETLPVVKKTEPAKVENTETPEVKKPKRIRKKKEKLETANA